MEIIIGVNPDEGTNDALALGAVLARSLNADPVLAHVHPASYDYVSRGNVDADWESYLHKNSLAILDEASERFTDRYELEPASREIGGHKSSGQGLADIAADRSSDLVVIGSAPGSSPGRFAIGSTADKLLHGSTVAVAAAPSGYYRHVPEKIGRVVVAFQDTPESRASVRVAAQYAERIGVPIRLLTVVLRHRMYGSKLGSSAEGVVMATLAEQTEEAQRAVLAAVAPSVPTETSVTIGDSPLAAVQRIDWAGDEIFVLGSAISGQLRRVFLGDMTYKLLRATPVPAVVLPRST